MWKAIEVFGDGAVTWVWQRELGDQTELVKQSFLRKLEREAMAMPCEQCGCWHRVSAAEIDRGQRDDKRGNHRGRHCADDSANVGRRE